MVNILEVAVWGSGERETEQGCGKIWFPRTRVSCIKHVMHISAFSLSNTWKLFSTNPGVTQQVSPANYAAEVRPGWQSGVNVEKCEPILNIGCFVRSPFEVQLPLITMQRAAVSE